MTTLHELATMLDEATGPSRELDNRIWDALNGCVGPTHGNWSSSIDAALALMGRMLPGWSWQINGGAYAILRPPKATCWSSSLCFDGDAPTAPLAILKATVAALIA